MMSPEDRRHSENCVINMSRTIGMAARICAIAFGFFGLCSIANALVFGFGFFTSGETPSIGMNGHDVSGWAGILYSLVLAVTALVLAVTLRAVFRFCDSIQQHETPFRRDSASMLRRVAHGIIAACLVWGLGTCAVELASGAPLGDLTAVLWIWAGVIVLFLAHVFEYGCALQEQDDELL